MGASLTSQLGTTILSSQNCSASKKFCQVQFQCILSASLGIIITVLFYYSNNTARHHEADFLIIANIHTLQQSSLISHCRYMKVTDTVCTFIPVHSFE